MDKYIPARNVTFNAFIALGVFLRDFCSGNPKNSENVEELENAIRSAGFKNGWFTRENVLFSLKTWGDLLEPEALQTWLSSYTISGKKASKVVALVMAGNIPLVGFHDLLAALLTGCTVKIKLSSNDDVLLSFIIDYLVSVEPSIKDRVAIVTTELKPFDAVIATGSNNTARYFEYYFGKGPNIIRKNRNSVAVLSGDESETQLKALGEDVFRYFGMGCRSVSKIFVPKDYDLDTFFKGIYTYANVMDLARYANNYDYNKAVYLMSDFKILDNGFLILKEDEGYASPIASLFYEYYSDKQMLKNRLRADKELLQCVVSEGFEENEIPFGHTQLPRLADYPDGKDTVDFLLKI